MLSDLRKEAAGDEEDGHAADVEDRVPERQERLAPNMYPHLRPALHAQIRWSYDGGVNAISKKYLGQERGCDQCTIWQVQLGLRRLSQAT